MFTIHCLKDDCCMGSAYALLSVAWTPSCTILVEHEAVIHYWIYRPLANVNFCAVSPMTTLPSLEPWLWLLLVSHHWLTLWGILSTLYHINCVAFLKHFYPFVYTSLGHSTSQYWTHKHVWISAPFAPSAHKKVPKFSIFSWCIVKVVQPCSLFTSNSYTHTHARMHTVSKVNTVTVLTHPITSYSVVNFWKFTLYQWST